VAITESTVAHWMSVLAAGRRISDAASGQNRALRERALKHLISGMWLNDEATRQGIKISTSDIQAQITRRRKDLAPGEAAVMASTGATTADVAFEAQAEVAAARLLERARDSVRRVTDREIGQYYARHRQEFVVPERRVGAITDRKTGAALELVRREVEHGASIATPQQKAVGEGRFMVGSIRATRNALERLMYRAKVKEVVGPVKIGPDYFLFRVDRIIPASYRDLREERQTLRKRLVARRQSIAETRLVQRVTTFWRSKTSCAPRYVVPECSQYRAHQGLQRLTFP